MPNDPQPIFTGDQSLKLDYRSPSSLTPYGGNARVHSRVQIKKIARSVTSFGWTNPILVDEAGTVLCGHGRLEAAKLLGMKTVPIIELSHLTEAQRKAYIVADNALAEQASWSRSMLRKELQGLAELGYELELTGFDTLRIDSFLSLDDDQEADPDDLVAEPDESRAPFSRLGDHWIIGDHQLICGDARDHLVYEALLGAELAQLIITDPPYNTVPERISKTHGAFVGGSGELSDTEFSMQLLRPALRCIRRWSSPGAIAFIFMDWRGGPRLLDAAEGVLHEQKNLIVWVKSNAGMGAFYRSQYELVYAFKVSPGEHINNFGLGGGDHQGTKGRHRSNVWSYAGANTFRKGRMDDIKSHPTVKPKKLLADAILDCSKRGGIVLDCFAGSGSTLIAAQMTGRRGRGIELDPKYCDLILNRLADETGVEPRLVDGTPLSQVIAERSAPVGEGA